MSHDDADCRNCDRLEAQLDKAEDAVEYWLTTCDRLQAELAKVKAERDAALEKVAEMRPILQQLLKDYGDNEQEDDEAYDIFERALRALKL